jgi:hypothetical protein
MLAHPYFIGRHWCWETCHKVPRATGTDTQLPDPRAAWGQTLQLRQRTQADDPGLRFSTGHRARWTHSPAQLAISDRILGGRRCRGLLPQGHSVPNPPRVVSYLSARLFSTTHRHTKGTAVNHHRRSPGLSRGLLGGVPTPNPQDHAQETHYLPEVE